MGGKSPFIFLEDAKFNDTLIESKQVNNREIIARIYSSTGQILCEMMLLPC